MNETHDSGGPAEILVVDDIAANRNLLRETLEPRGYEVLLAANGQHAIDIASNVRPDAVLLDVNMPGMNGFETCRALKAFEATRHIPVIFITANDGTEDLVAGFEAGGVDYVTKPFKAQEVLRRLETHLQLSRLNRALVEKNSQLETARQAAEEARALADEANKAKSRFLANMSHELRTPLNAIIGYSEMVEEELEEVGVRDVIPDLQRIQAAARHQLGLVNDILDLSKIEAGKMTLFLEDFDVGRLVNEVASTVQPLIAKNGNRLLIECPPGLGIMRADQTKVRQTLFNLLSNASKFTEKGTIMLRVARAASDECPVTSGARHTSLVTFSVTDTGICMTAEQLGRLFQAFSQAEASTATKYGGTGLGLVLSRRFCQLMGGDLGVTSEPGKGSTFTATLPGRVGEAATS